MLFFTKKLIALYFMTSGIFLACFLFFRFYPYLKGFFDIIVDNDIGKRIYYLKVLIIKKGGSRFERTG